METPMTEWNDDRLDELNGRMKEGFAEVDKRFDKVDARFVRLEGEMKQSFAKVDWRFEKADHQFATKEELNEVKMELRRLNDRFDRLLHMLTVVAWGFAGTLVAALVGLAVVLV